VPKTAENTTLKGGKGVNDLEKAKPDGEALSRASSVAGRGFTRLASRLNSEPNLPKPLQSVKPEMKKLPRLASDRDLGRAIRNFAKMEKLFERRDSGLALKEHVQPQQVQGAQPKQKLVRQGTMKLPRGTTFGQLPLVDLSRQPTLKHLMDSMKDDVGGTPTSNFQSPKNQTKQSLLMQSFQRISQMNMQERLPTFKDLATPNKGSHISAELQLVLNSDDYDGKCRVPFECFTLR
jgi:hypothetical protein